MFKAGCVQCARIASGSQRLLSNRPVGVQSLPIGQSTSRALRASTSAFLASPLSSARYSSNLAEAVLEEEEAEVAESSSGITLRPYQQDAIEACLDALKDGKTRIGVSSPTGSGKTTIFTHLIPQIEAKRGSRGQVLILVGNIELANQAYGAVRRTLPDLSVELEQSKNKATGLADVTIATYQTMNNESRREKFNPKDFKLIIVDEAHHAAANSYLRLLNFFNHKVAVPLDDVVQPHNNEIPIIGFSATFSRPDQLALNLVFEEIVYHQEVSHMLREGWLSPARVTSLKVDLNLADVKIGRDGDYSSSSLAAHVNTEKVNRMIVGVYLDQIVNRRSTLVFCVDLAHVHELANTFRAAGIDARAVSSKTKPAERRKLVEDFRAGVFPVLVNCEIFTEGTDIPEIDSIILARPTKSRNLLAQMVGRGLRLSADTGKVDCRLIDVVDNVGRANGMVAVPTLFGLSLDEKEEREFKEGTAAPVVAKREIDPKRVTYVDHDDPFGVDRDTVPILRKLSPNAWVACGGGKYVLELMFDRGYITVQLETTQLYAIFHTPRLPNWALTGSKNPNGRPIPIAQAPTVDRALQTADAFAARSIPRDLALLSIHRRAPWRSKPPSSKQLAALTRVRGMATGDEKAKLPTHISIGGRQIELAKLTCGQVASFITAARHGALGLRQKQYKKEVREEVKEQAQEKKRLAALARAVPISKKVA